MAPKTPVVFPAPASFSPGLEGRKHDAVVYENTELSAQHLAAYRRHQLVAQNNVYTAVLPVQGKEDLVALLKVFREICDPNINKTSLDNTTPDSVSNALKQAGYVDANGVFTQDFIDFKKTDLQKIEIFYQADDQDSIHPLHISSAGAVSDGLKDSDEIRGITANFLFEYYCVGGTRRGAKSLCKFSKKPVATLFKESLKEPNHQSGDLSLAFFEAKAAATGAFHFNLSKERIKNNLQQIKANKKSKQQIIGTLNQLDDPAKLANAALAPAAAPVSNKYNFYFVAEPDAPTARKHWEDHVKKINKGIADFQIEINKPATDANTKAHFEGKLAVTVSAGQAYGEYTVTLESGVDVERKLVEQGTLEEWSFVSADSAEDAFRNVALALYATRLKQALAGNPLGTPPVAARTAKDIADNGLPLTLQSMRTTLTQATVQRILEEVGFKNVQGLGNVQNPVNPTLPNNPGQNNSANNESDENNNDTEIEEQPVNVSRDISQNQASTVASSMQNNTLYQQTPKGVTDPVDDNSSSNPYHKTPAQEFNTFDDSSSLRSSVSSVDLRSDVSNGEFDGVFERAEANGVLLDNNDNIGQVRPIQASQRRDYDVTSGETIIETAKTAVNKVANTLSSVLPSGAKVEKKSFPGNEAIKGHEEDDSDDDAASSDSDSDSDLEERVNQLSEADLDQEINALSDKDELEQKTDELPNEDASENIIEVTPILDGGGLRNNFQDNNGNSSSAFSRESIVLDQNTSKKKSVAQSHSSGPGLFSRVVSTGLTWIKNAVNSGSSKANKEVTPLTNEDRKKYLRGGSEKNSRAEWRNRGRNSNNSNNSLELKEENNRVDARPNFKPNNN